MNEAIELLREMRDDMRALRKHLERFEVPEPGDTRQVGGGDAYAPILETYRERINPRGQMTTKSREKIQVRVSQGYTVEQLCQCLVNASLDPWWTKTRNPIAFYYATQERVETLLALDIAAAAEAVEEVRGDERNRAFGCTKCGSDRFRHQGTVWHCEACGYTRQGSADRHPGTGTDPRSPEEQVAARLRTGRAVSIGRLAAGQPESQRPGEAPAISSGNFE
jgi:ribosomal protein L37AE/L43A